MHKKLQILSVFLILLLMLTGCFGTANPAGGTTGTTAGGGTITRPITTKPNRPGNTPEGGDTTTEDTAMGRDETAYGDSLEDLGVWNGYAENIQNNVKITCLTGSANRYRIEGDVITFNPMAAESVYTIEGTWKGSIVINTGDDYKFTLEMHGLTLISETTNAITVQSGDEVSVTAKKGYNNYIYDMRPAIDETDTTLHPGAIYSNVDLEIAGKGVLTVVSENNNGIQTKDDLQVKNLTLTVVCQDNALKGNDSVEILSADLTLIACAGDGIKTTSSDISSKGNQRGTVSITDSICTVYAARDGIDAAYDVVISGATSTVDIYTDRYSNYSDIADTPAEVQDVWYISIPADSYFFSVKYYNSDSDFVWENATHHSGVAEGATRVHYYTVPTKAGYAQMQFFVYASEADLGQDVTYLYATDLLTPHSSYDTYAFEQLGSSFDGGWENMTVASASSKGIKAANEVVINAGTVGIKSHDDGIHVNGDTALENGKEPLGNLTVKGGSLTVYTNDDGLHADGAIAIKGGAVKILHSYEGVEGATVSVTAGSLSVVALDDGVNATAVSGSAIAVSGGTVYVYCNGDGLDSNSKSSGAGISFSGGTSVIITATAGHSAIDSEKGYSYTGGKVLALMSEGGLVQEAVNCSNFANVGTQASFTATAGIAVRVTVGGTEQISVTVPCDLAGTAVYLGANNAEISAA